MKLAPAKFNQFLNGIGQNFFWRKAYACPCVSSHSGQARVDCTHCSGIGRIWDAPIMGKAGVVGRSVMKKFATFGVWEDDDVMLSIPSDSVLYKLGQYDRISAVNRTEPFSLNLVYGVNDVLRFIPVSVDRVFWYDTNNVLIEGDVPVLDWAGELLWIGLRPPAKTTYSMTGRRHPEYYIFNEIPLDRAHHQGLDLPRRVIIRRFEKYGVT